jgi:hypothetical protein
MKTLIATVFAGTILMSFIMNNTGALGERITQTVTNMRSHTPIAYASTKDLGQVSIVNRSVHEHVQHLQTITPDACFKAHTYLAEAYDLYSGSTIDATMNSILTIEAGSLCPLMMER